METQKLSKKELFLSLSAASALFWVGAFFCDGYGIEAEGLVLLIPPLLAIVFGIIAIAMKDDSTKGTSNVSSSQQQSSKYQDLIKLKELMDSGVITKEEFEEQKKILLN